MDGYRILESFIYNITSPLVLVDGSGKKCSANRAGEKNWSDLLLLLESVERNGLLSQQAFIQSCLKRAYPSWVAMEGALLKITPLAAGLADESEAAGLLEWQPGAGFDSGKEKLQILQEVSRAVNSSLIMEDIFEALGEVLRNHIPYQEAVIVILDNSQNGIKTLVRIFEDGDLEISGEHNAFAGYEPLVDQVLRQPFSHLYSRDALPESFLIAENAVSALVVPLVNKGVVIGLIAMSTSDEGGFYHYQEELLTEVSAQLAVAVENAKFYWQTQAQAGREFLINQLTRSIRQSLDIDIILGTAVTELGKVIGVSRCFIRYFSPDGQEKAFQYQLPGTRRLGADELSFEKAVFALRKDQPFNPFILNDIRDCPSQLATQTQLQECDIKSLAIFPILIRDALVGTITLHQCDAFRVWVMEDIELLRALAEHLGVALHQAQLFLELDQQKRALEQTLEELQQAQLYLIQSEKMAVLGQFVAGIAHEVNTPLGTMVSNNATLKVCFDKLKQLPFSADENATGPSAEQLFTSVENLLSLNKLASTRIQDIVKNLRNFARLDESELKIVDLHEGIDSTILLIQSSIDPKIRIVRNYATDLPPVQCYPGLLNQVFMNLLVNAAHAIQDVKPSPGWQPEIEIDTAYSPDADRISIAIRDTGKGIPEENMAKVFDPGFTTKGAGVGTGLGLALCYRIVEKHHGRIAVDSVVNQGTRFCVEIPARSATGTHP
ncbi:MAG: histidine kinase with domain [Vampirovibrio sp.]|jgi:signal transduction histidine kinase|nr:histidine kinase with domain [Vampirovibrio sp.]